MFFNSTSDVHLLLLFPSASKLSLVSLTRLMITPHYIDSSKYRCMTVDWILCSHCRTHTMHCHLPALIASRGLEHFLPALSPGNSSLTISCFRALKKLPRPFYCYIFKKKKIHLKLCFHQRDNFFTTNFKTSLYHSEGIIC